MDDTGIEPVASSVSGKRSPAELIILIPSADRFGMLLSRWLYPPLLGVQPLALVSRKVKDQGKTWLDQDLNLSRHYTPTGLQPAPIGRSGTQPCCQPRIGSYDFATC